MECRTLGKTGLDVSARPPWTYHRSRRRSAHALMLIAGEVGTISSLA